MSDNCCNLTMEVDENPRVALEISGANYYGPYELPTMSADTKGGAMLGSGLEIDSDTLSIDLTNNATGESITATDASYLASLTVDGKAVQDGTPTPSNPVPIEVVQGINIMPTTVYQLAVSGTDIAANSNYRAMYAPVEAGKTYTVSRAAVKGNRFRIYTTETEPAVGVTANFAFGDNDTALTATVTIPSGAKWVFIYLANDGSDVSGADMQLEVGSTATPYVPYGSIGLKVGSTITPINLQGNVLASLPDGTKDVLTVDSVGHVVMEKRVGVVDLGSLTWSRGERPANSGLYRFGSSNFDTGGTGTRVNLLSSMYIADGVTGPTGNNSVDGAMCMYANAVYIRNDVYSDTSAFKTAMTGVLLYYELATPTTIDLGYIDMPAIPDGATISITAQVTPTIAASWWARGAAAVAEALKAVRARLQAIETQIANIATS